MPEPRHTYISWNDEKKKLNNHLKLEESLKYCHEKQYLL